MKKYVVTDLKYGRETIGFADNLREVKKIAKEYGQSCEFDCSIWYCPLNEETGKYKFSERVFLEHC